MFYSPWFSFVSSFSWALVVCSQQMHRCSSAVLTPAALVADILLTHSWYVDRAAKGKVRGESHIDFRTQSIVMRLEGGGHYYWRFKIHKNYGISKLINCHELSITNNKLHYPIIILNSYLVISNLFFNIKL